MKPLAADLVRRGYSAWNIEYRRIGRRQGGGYPNTFDDVAAAIDHLASVGDERLDMDDVTFLGHSAGGHLALWAASRDGNVEPARVIAQAPITNLVSAGPPAHVLMGGEPREVPDRYAQCDPMRLLPVGKPLLLVHGADDATIPIQRTREYLAAAAEAGDDVDLIEPAPGGHRSHIDPRSGAWRGAAEWLTAQRSTLLPGGR
jgi:alpha-beta hydrolase superfamily lysophospholipase